MHLKTPMSLRTLTEKRQSVLRNQVFKIPVLAGGSFIHHPVLLSFSTHALLCLVPELMFTFNKALAVGHRDFRLCICTGKVYSKCGAKKPWLSCNKCWRGMAAGYRAGSYSSMWFLSFLLFVYPGTSSSWSGGFYCPPTKSAQQKQSINALNPWFLSVKLLSY